MSHRPIAKDQPKSFKFSAKATKELEKIIKKYPAGRQASAVLPALDIAQRENGGWLSNATIEKVAELLDMPFIRVYEVATFYSMFNLAPVGKYFVQICRTTPCWLRGSDEITDTCKKKLGIEIGETTPDGEFTLAEVECLGACVNAPVVQINDDFYEDLDAKSMKKLLDALRNGEEVAVGTQKDRQNSAPEGEWTSLVE